MRPALLVFLLLSALLGFALANYGRVEKDVGPPEEFSNLDSEKLVDDADIPADDEALENVEKESQELAEKLKEMEQLRSRIKSKNELLKRVQSLRTKLNDTVKLEEEAKEQEEKVEESVTKSMKKNNETYDEKEHIADQRRKIEQRTQKVVEEEKKFEVELARVEEERKRKEADEKELQLEQERLVKEVNALVSQFKDHGMHTWLEQNVKRFPPVIRETILKSSAVLNPVLDGVEGVAEINEQLTNETTEAITQYLPAIKNSPFYTGLIFYIILLCPLVAVIWLVMKVRARLSLMTIEHYLIAINMYFGILSLACAVMTMLGKTDILIVFRHRAQRLAESFMILHGFLFILHLVLHGITAYVSGSRKDFAQYIGISFVGLHFFTNAYKRTILDQDPNIGAPAYIVYATFFLYTLYDRGVHILEAAVKDDKANAAAFRTYAGSSSQNLPVTTASKEKRDTTVYFAGLPVFNGPAQMSLDDAKNI
ncbi:hypothetical protein BWQ96_04315 [Gracilariopsis chorda]|uniref:Uncharacterized protein n=1 Tax=Gracilariopsis chorda TaxID=448386 RepID=A0A2V3IXM1_9FLOR|nr:hypothetical protein BWQ96_04315 [Gracilariopsis chorda]|eukprot:PXF45880.1 hypothetical protein BWQ96_04315 [Gracilariopsis chorda]